MKITELEIKDFGRHKHIHEKGLDAVVGLIGPNGAGKSTVLQAIEYAFTGQLEDKASTYIRTSGVKKPKSASVRIHFEKNGQSGSIFRKFTETTSSRELVWDGNTYTKAKDVDTLVAEVLGADKAAIKNAIFIAQGELDKLLFGTPAERHELFTKVLGVGYITQRAEALAAQVKSLETYTRDYNLDMDALKARIREAQDEVEELSKELSGSYLYEDELKKWTQLRDLKQLIRTREGRINGMKIGIKDTQEKIAAETAVTIEGVEDIDLKDIDQVIDKVQTMNEDLKAMTEETSRLQEIRAQQARAIRLGEERDSVQAKLQSVNNHIENLEKELKDTYNLDVGQLAETLQNLEASKAQQVRLDEAKAKQSKADADLLETKKELVKLKLNPPDEARLLEVQARTTAIEKEIAPIKMRIRMIEEVVNSEEELTLCPLCGHELTGEETFTQDLPELKEQQAALFAEHTTLDLEWKRLSTARGDYEVKEQYLNKVAGQQQLDLTNATAELAKITVPEVTITTEQGHELMSLMTRFEQFIRDKTYAQDKLQEVQSQLENTVAPDDFNESVLTALRENHRKLSDTYDTLNRFLREQQDNYSKIKDLQRAIELQQEEYSTDIHRQHQLREELSHSQPFMEVADYWTEDDWKITQDHTDEYNRVSEEKYGVQDIIEKVLKDKNAQHHELSGKVQQAQVNVDKLHEEEVELQKQIDKNLDVLKLIEDMRTLRGAFMKEGVLALYLESVFTQLAEITQNTLADIDANFAIMPHPETPLTFLFRRLDEVDGEWMDQSKLSGGQRVRLTVAFLLAVQKVVIPDVGFLVLDEPSQHMDESGVESLKTLLMSLSDTINSKQAQVVVCDHNPTLVTAFNSCIKL